MFWLLLEVFNLRSKLHIEEIRVSMIMLLCEMMLLLLLHMVPALVLWNLQLSIVLHIWLELEIGLRALHVLVCT